MIKHDYKPQNNQRILDSDRYATLPAWASHPYMIIGYAFFTALLAYFLWSDQSSPTPKPATLVTQAPQQPSTENLADTSTTNKKIETESGELQLFGNEKAVETSNSAEITESEPLETLSVGPNPATSQANQRFSAPIAIPLSLEKYTTTPAKFETLAVDTVWQKEAVKKGDNLSLIFKRIGLSPKEVHRVITLDDNTKRLKNLKPGQVLSYQLTNTQQLAALKYVIDIQNTLYVERIDHADIGGNASSQKSNHFPVFKSRLANKTIDYRVAYVDGVIHDSLYLSGQKAGLSDSLIIKLANIFDWDIDFVLDIRNGDTFSLLYEEKYLDGEKIGDGDIVAAEFVNQGQVFKAVRYKDSKGNTSYYTPDGLSMRKAFLRAPIKFSYISSGFKPRRFHPILKRWKAHRGIDYRAKTGTPIRAAGDGKVIQSSQNKYNGKYVFIQHGQGIVTKYLHMSRRAISRGKRVKQGQVIGYVGMTGLAEAPHLHYEFVVNGVHRNPRTVKLPKAAPISKSEKTAFLSASQQLIAQLETRKRIQSTTLVAR